MGKRKSIEALLCMHYGHPVFAELVDFLGHETALEFIEIFGGTAIHVPNIEELQKITREYEIFRQCRNGTKTTTLAKRFKMTPKKVRSIRDRIGKIVQPNNNLI